MFESVFRENTYEAHQRHNIPSMDTQLNRWQRNTNLSRSYLLYTDDPTLTHAYIKQHNNTHPEDRILES